ncbi:Flp pilus assembly protein CpaB [Virgibacillus subterraneus]|uniref:Flp pilus assembly protein CpaB n=1 Tax=Virgibacillus subterraneus TaxID=621109 RepID=A0A1H9BGZ5_9BACI|nr:Flp pilus assembly protein CpaB [Virgibacillus subterraneus]SEP87893.1 Flp pilus assembly protein CpaB [Virgibacillus subterraneus]
MKARRIVLLALISGIITTGIFYIVMNQAAPSSSNPTEQTEVVEVVAANTDIAIDQKITDENLNTKEVPKDQVHTESVKEKEEVIGKFASADIKAGEVIMNHRIRTKEEVTDVVSRKITENKRGVSVKVEFDESVSNLTAPGDYVDVMSNVVLDKSIPLIETDLILEKVRVLAVGERMVEKKDGDVEKTYMTVTLELSKEDSVELVHASELGSIHLALYSKVDSVEEKDPEKESGEKQEPDEKEKDNEESEAKIGDEKDTRFVTTPERSIIRKAPQLTAPVLTVVDQGTALLFLNDQETDDDERVWFKVKTNKKKDGWVSSRIVKHEDE